MMKRSLAAVLSISALFLLAACGEQVSDEREVDSPATLTEVDNEAGDEVMQIGLTSEAAERLGIETVPVAKDGKLTRVPLAAVFLDSEGGYWVYTNPEALKYIREPIQVKTEEGDLVFVSEGPPPGTEIVTVGVPELWGAETGFGE